ncbi:MAG: DUF1080 domain-containing protein [Verrucomicrobia bacterium]|nr:DUF1080 domain-containing protein [Verrucomicrobiota bacterium]
MKSLIAWIPLTAALAFCGCHSPSGSSASVSLFNGKDIKNWVKMHGGDWTVENGEIVARNGIDWSTNPKKSGSWLCSREEYSDFILELEYSVNTKGNSGVFIRSRLDENPAFTGHEVQILDDHGRTPAVWTTGALYDVKAPSKNLSKPAGEWNHLTIICKGREITTMLNGEEILRYNESRRLSGYIGLQNHDDKAVTRFRNIQVQRL